MRGVFEGLIQVCLRVSQLHHISQGSVDFGGWALVLGFGADAGGGPKYLPTLAPRVEATVFGATLVGHDLGTCLRVPPLSL